MTVAANNLPDKMWRTAKCRMRAEGRYRAYNRTTHFFICYYSFLLIATSIFSSEISSQFPFFDKMNVVLSVLVFALSLLLSGYRLSEIADKHRACYLALQKLQSLPTSDMSADYHQILDLYPNHAPRDDADLIVEQARRQHPVQDSVSGRELRPTRLEIASYWGRRLFFLILWTVAFAGPLVLAALLIYIDKL